MRGQNLWTVLCHRCPGGQAWFCPNVPALVWVPGLVGLPQVSLCSSSLSFHSTPPPLPLLQQSPATLPLALPGGPAPLPPQPQNGLGRAPGAAGLGAMPMAEGLLGGLAGSGALPLNGLLGGLNGAAAPNPAGLSQAGGAPTLQLPGCLNR